MSNAVAASDSKRAKWAVGRLRFESIGFLFAVSFLVLLDGVNGAMCSTLKAYLSGGLSVNPDQITWGAIFYYVGKLHMLLLAAKLQMRFGQRRAFQTAAIVLVLATAAGAFVPTYSSFLVVLLIQGGAGGAIIALGQGTLLTIFPRRDQPLVQGAFALATVMYPATIVPALLGGWAYNFDWRLAYLGIAPFGLLGCGWLFWKQRWLSNSTRPTEFMPGRVILIVTALFSIVYIFQQGERNRWLEYPPMVWALLLAAACIVSVAFIETRGGETFLPYRAFRYANFTFGTCVVLLAGVALFGSGYVISGFASGVLAYPVSWNGLVQLSGTFFATISFLAVGALIRYAKFPPVFSILTGVLLFGVSMWHLGDAPSNLNFEGYASWLIVRGFALGCQFIPLTLMALTCLPAEVDVAAAGLFNFNRQIGALGGIAWLQTLLETKTDNNQTIFGNVVSWMSANTVSYNQAVQNALLLHGAPPAQVPAVSTALTLQEAHRQWASIAFNGCFESLAVVFLFAFPLVVVVRILTTRFLKPPEC
ncbi:MAG TPA: MFS transporter [Verrucomicrobiae bacterium]|jgi:DHA2 family multidrug resistance protein